VTAAGGVNGRKLVLTYCDSQYDNVQTHNCSNEMVSAKVLAVVGWTAPKGENNEVKFLAQDQGIPIVGGLGTPDEYAYPLSYPVSTPFTRTGTALGAQVAAAGIKHPAIITLTDVPWIAPVRQKLVDALHANGVQETHIEDATATDPDYTGHVGNLMHSSDRGPCAANAPGGACPDGLIAALDPFSYSRLFQAMNRSTWHPPVVAGGLDKGNQQDRYAGQIEGSRSLVPFLSPYDHPSNATVTDYLGAVQHYYPNQVPALDVYTQISWTSAQVFVEAVKRAGANLTRKTLVDALNTIQNFDTGWSKPISYSAGGSHDPNHCVVFMQHDNKSSQSGGTWHQYTDWQCFP
jgi:ABC-type branched-subunit amino acid transport system substrate-binding protein